MIKLNVEITETATELIQYIFEWDMELTLGVRDSTYDYPEIHNAVYNLLDHNGFIEKYVTYNISDLELVDATLGKRGILTYAIPVELDDEALLMDYGDV